MAENTIPPILGTAKQLETKISGTVFDMEEPLSRLHDLLTGLMHLGQTLDDGGSAVARIAEYARDECEKTKRLHDQLFDDLRQSKEAAQ